MNPIDTAVGNVILASNDGRFLVLQVSSDIRSLIAKTPDSPGSSTRPLTLLTVALFHVRTVSLVSNCMISTGGVVCLSLSNPSGTSQLSVFPLADSLDAVASASATGTPGKVTITHDLINIPGDCVATGPVVMALDPSSSQSGQPENLAWFGTAGGGSCHCLNLTTKKFIQRFV
ncbi:unnamed protein product [Echinostoma caproni]|uniref:MMS1_N domain-containing protein n=1 Tax=Echinostoma caproni TaxID=27848 RepID=A0A183BGS7_9TREM|nr:unnamed protein product [Echinostoma caproni]